MRLLLCLSTLGILSCASGRNETSRSAQTGASSDKATSSKASSEANAPAKAERKAPSAARTKATKNIKEAVETSPEEMRGRLASQGLSEVDDYPLTAAERKALSFAAGGDVDPSQCETVLAATVAELDATLVEPACGERDALMKALASGSLEKRIALASERCKVKLEPAQRTHVTPMAVVMSAVVRAQFEADSATSDEERTFAGHVTQVCRR